jgi:hypothetical protein
LRFCISKLKHLGRSVWWFPGGSRALGLLGDLGGTPWTPRGRLAVSQGGKYNGGGPQLNSPRCIYLPGRPQGAPEVSMGSPQDPPEGRGRGSHQGTTIQTAPNASILRYKIAKPFQKHNLCLNTPCL